MSAVPGDEHGPDDEWVDEWNADDWHALNVIDRNERNEDSWRDWALKLLVVAIGLPLVLGLLLYLFILVS
ncbi:MAG: hypothetical protein ACR2PK_08570 [Acidimicrobiales bacterium]